ncbi:MAG: D-Ala-D-Ala carboxypeptidase family metallohydrolase [Paludibacteraceae bacterium]|nr:D-Ala-D-Ala carboxypeptidase family metallohydrolase [Paludibacteraceae bacterium]
MNKKKFYTILIAIVVLVGIYFLPPVRQCVRGGLTGEYFVEDDLCFSWTAIRRGIINKPTDVEKQNIKALINNVLNPARKEYGSYIKVNSGYRCAELNKYVGGKPNSQHTKGQAVDIICKSESKTNDLYKLIKRSGKYDQLLFERTKNSKYHWIHVSWRSDGKNRKQAIGDYVK